MTELFVWRLSPCIAPAKIQTAAEIVAETLPLNAANSIAVAPLEATPGSEAAMAQAKALIDYYVQTQPPGWVNYLSLVAIVISLFAIWASLEQAFTTQRSHIRTEWNGIVDICLQHPEFMDVYFTSNYVRCDPKKRLIYDAFSYKLWSLFNFIVDRRMTHTESYSAILIWSVAFHRAWIIDNPYLFASANFWESFERTRNEPLTIFRNPLLPLIDAKPSRQGGDRYSDQVDWDAVSPNYHELIISPWAPVMTTPDSAGQIRNPLIKELRNYIAPYSLEDLKTLRVLDFGCGPGNLIEHLPPEITEIYGLDISETALKIAGDKARARGITFHPIKDDMRTFIDTSRFDIIISCNSVLPNTREDVILIFDRLKQNLKPQGRILAILPAFDACETLMDYWKDVYRTKAKQRNRFAKNDQYAEKAMQALNNAKKIDRTNFSFADDSVHSQCFHTPVTIEKEFKQCGLSIEKDPVKVYYPWEYARIFDYGYFPDKPEIWDWFVQAKRGSN